MIGESVQNADEGVALNHEALTSLEEITGQVEMVGVLPPLWIQSRSFPCTRMMTPQPYRTSILDLVGLAHLLCSEQQVYARAGQILFIRQTGILLKDL
jgi:hypothetical protein